MWHFSSLCPYSVSAEHSLLYLLSPVACYTVTQTQMRRKNMLWIYPWKKNQLIIKFCISWQAKFGPLLTHWNDTPSTVTLPLSPRKTWLKVKRQEMWQTEVIMFSRSLQKWEEMTNVVMKKADELSSRLRICSGKLKPAWVRTKTLMIMSFFLSRWSYSLYITCNCFKYECVCDTWCVCLCVREQLVEFAGDADQISGWPWGAP